MRNLTEHEIELVAGGATRDTSWTFRAQPITTFNAEGATQQLRANMAGGAVGGFIAGVDPLTRIAGAMGGAAGGAMVSAFSIGSFSSTATPTIRIFEMGTASPATQAQGGGSE
jgi:hypothetical protein